MSIEQMRVYIAEHPKYKNSPNWRYRCQTMPSSQVVAIYNNFRKMDYKKIEKEIQRQRKTKLIKTIMKKYPHDSFLLKKYALISVLIITTC